MYEYVTAQKRLFAKYQYVVIGSIVYIFWRFEKLHKMEEQADVDFFIEEIKKHPEIWNVSDSFYFDRKKKRVAWSNICAVFVKEFEQKPSGEKNEIRDKFKKKWRNIRDSFMKNEKKKTKSGQADDTSRDYIYAQQLSFLRTAGTTTEAQSNDRDTSANHQNPERINVAHTPNPPQYGGLKRKRDMESALINFLEMPIPSTTASLDPDRSFFESIIPAIEKFSIDKKLEFQCEVLKLVQRMRADLNIQENSEHNTITNQPPQLSENNTKIRRLIGSHNYNFQSFDTVPKRPRILDPLASTPKPSQPQTNTSSFSSAWSSSTTSSAIDEDSD